MNVIESACPEQMINKERRSPLPWQHPLAVYTTTTTTPTTTTTTTVDIWVPLKINSAVPKCKSDR